MRPDRVIHVDGSAWPAFNRASFDQDKLTSWRDHQYSVYWSADETLMLARRDLRDNSIQKLRFPEHTLTTNPTDPHRNTVLGLSPGDGRLHVSFDHHNNDLRYVKSRPGFVTDPPEAIAASDFEPRQELTADAPQGVTYPRFFNDPHENLFLIYRTGTSGSGDSVFARYNADSGSWALLSTCLLSRKGTYPPWNNSQSRNAYLHDVLFDNVGRLHITWVYREASPSWASNHDLHYAWSDDQGLTWRNNAGAQIASPAEGDPIALGDPGIVVREIPVYSWLMNQCGMALDRANRPHVATFHMPAPFKPAELEHEPPADVRDRLAIRHYWQSETGDWRGSGEIANLVEGRGRSRPNIVVDTQGNAIIYWSSKVGYQCYVSLASTNYREGRTFPLTGSEFAEVDACKHDRRLLRDRGVLSFTAEPAGANAEAAGFSILDFRLDSILHEAQEG